MPLIDLAPSQQQEIRETLERFGLRDKEQAVYLELLALGKTTATPLAEAAKIPVTTAQSILQRLAKTGLIAVSARKSRHVYEAHDPIALRRLLERQIQELQGTIPLLQSLRSEELSPAKVRIYTRERSTDLFHRALQSKNKLIYEIVSARDFQEILGERFHFTRRRVKAGIHLKSLRVEAHELKQYSQATHHRELREAKFLPRELTFRTSILFWDDSLAFFSGKQEGLAILIQSPLLREMMQQLFDLLWNVSRKMETAKEAA